MLPEIECSTWVISLFFPPFSFFHFFFFLFLILGDHPWYFQEARSDWQVPNRAPGLHWAMYGLGMPFDRQHSVCSFKEEFSLRASHPKPRSELPPRPSKANSVLCSIYLNVSAGYLFTPKFKLRNPSGKDERKGRRVAGQQKQKRRETCAQIAHMSTPQPLQAGRSFLNPQNPARVFLGEDWPLCSVFILGLFTLFPTPGALSSSPISPAFSSLSELSEETR